MKKYILLAIAALSFTRQSIQCADFTYIHDMWQWEHKWMCCEWIAYLKGEIQRLIALDAPYSEISSLQKACDALEADQADSSIDMYNAIRIIPTASITKTVFSGVGAGLGFCMVYLGLTEAYKAYCAKEGSSKEKNIEGKLSLAVIGAVLMGITWPGAYEAFKA